MTLRSILRFTFRRKNRVKEEVAVATNSPADDATPWMPSDPDMTELESMFNNVVWARENSLRMLRALKYHIDEHKDPMDCDAWCFPESLSKYLSGLSRQQLVILFAVVLKNFFWTQYEVDSSET